jgi:hypothetical protein
MKRFLTICAVLFLSIKPSFALISWYVGAGFGGATSEMKADEGSSPKLNGMLISGQTGVELNLLITKLGVELFAEKLFAKKDEIKDPFYYGAKGKLMLNLFIAEPYIAVGYGKEKIQDYKNDFILAGAGIQAKLFGIGAYVEANYVTSLSKFKGAKTTRTTVLLGMKYYII